MQNHFIYILSTSTSQMIQDNNRMENKLPPTTRKVSNSYVL